MSILVNAYSTQLETTTLNFPHKMNGRRDQTDPELLEHLNGFEGYVFSRGEREMTATKYHLIQHIQRVRQHLSFEMEDENLNELSDWAWDNNCILFFPDSTIRDPSGRVIISYDGEPDDEPGSVPYPRDAINRCKKTLAFLLEHDISVPHHLPPVLGVAETMPRSAAEVAQRALALFLVALRAESVAAKDEISVEELQTLRPISFQGLSPAETAFLHTDTPDELLVVSFSWRYEALYLLMWALQLFEDLPFPSEICDVPKLAKTMFSQDEQLFASQVSLRPTAELLDALDLHYRLHWFAVETRVNKKLEQHTIEEGVVQERHYALNWLLKFQLVHAAWDEIDTPT